jgi:hypothetical protein
MAIDRNLVVVIDLFELLKNILFYFILLYTLF